jgi:hypothetical protein
MHFITNYSKKGTHVIALKGISFPTNFKCMWKGSGIELLTPIASNKNMQKFNKNLKVMIKVINVQLFKKGIGAMTSEEINLKPPLKMRMSHVNKLKKLQGTPMNPNPKVIQKLPSRSNKK